MTAFSQPFSIIADTITINPITGVQAGSTFTVTGSLAGFAAIPSLSYSDDGGASVPITSGTTQTSFSFSHPGVVAGNHTLAIFVTGNSRTTTLSYSVANSTAPGPVTGISLLSASSTTLTITFTPPDTSQTYSYNINIGTSGLGGPFPMQTTGNVLQSGDVTLSGLTAKTAYYLQIFAVAPGGLIGSAATAGPFSTTSSAFTINPIIATAGSPFEVSGTIN